MSSNVAPLIIGLFAAGLLLILIGVVPAIWRPVERFRLQRRSRKSEDETTSEEWMDQPRAPAEGETEPAGPMAETDAGVGEPSGDRQGSSAAIEEVEPPTEELLVAAERHDEGVLRESEADATRITEDARRAARDLLEEAELEAKRIVVAAGKERARHENELEQERAALEERRTRLDSLATAQVAELKAEELLIAAERQCESLLRESGAEAERKAAEITDGAQRQARERLEEAELEAKGIVVATSNERARLLNELAQERAVMKETRARLGSIPAIEEAAHHAEELLLAAEQQREDHRRESEAEAERKAAEITDGARRQAQELVEEAELEAKGIVVATSNERARLLNELAQERSALEEARTRLESMEAIEKAEKYKAEELLIVAERQSQSLRRESEAEAERKTAALIDGARRQAQELLAEAELEAKRIVGAAGQERAQLEDKLAQERSVFEERRTRLSGFLADVLEEVEGTPAASDGPAHVRDLDGALSVTTSAGSDH